MARRGRNGADDAPDAGDLGIADDQPVNPVDLIGGNGGGDGGGDGRSGDGGGSDGNDFVFDAARHISPDKRNADGSYRRKRQRKGGGNASRKAASASPLSVSGIEAILLSVHAVAASSLRVPELQLDKTEAEQLATGIAEVARHYPTTIDPKILAWVNLAMVAGMVYGPRFWVIRDRARKAGSNKPTRADPKTTSTMDDEAARVAAMLGGAAGVTQ